MPKPPRHLAVLAALALLPAGCATPGAILDDSVGKVRAGVAAVDQQSRLAFTNANDLVREQEIHRAVLSPSTDLSEGQFAVAVTADDAVKWRASFGRLDAYLAALQLLVDTRRAATTSSNLNALGTELQSGVVGAELPTGVSGAFASLGGAIVQARAEKTATAVMRKTDPAFRATMEAMRDAIGPREGPGLAATVANQWLTISTRQSIDYAGLRPDDLGGRDRAIRDFLKTTDAREAQLGDLAALRDSLAALEEAHTAAANGSSGDALYWIGRIDGILTDIKASASQSGGKAR